MKLRIILPFIAALALAGCANPYSPGQRAAGGGLIGAGAGAALSTLVGGNPLTGALIGGGVGALAGYATTPPQPEYHSHYRHHRY